MHAMHYNRKTEQRVKRATDYTKVNYITIIWGRERPLVLTGRITSLELGWLMKIVISELPILPLFWIHIEYISF